jgi:hypothetical protein
MSKHYMSWQELKGLNGPKIEEGHIASILRYNLYLDERNEATQKAVDSGAYSPSEGWHKNRFLALRTKWRKANRKADRMTRQKVDDSNYRPHEELDQEMMRYVACHYT